MTRPFSFRLVALAASMAVVLSCDAGSPSGLPEFGSTPGTGTIGGPGTGTTGGDGQVPVASIDTPAVARALFNVGDSILVAVRMRDNSSGIKSVQIAGLSVRGSRDLGTEKITERYRTVTAPADPAGFPARTAVGRDTVVRRYLFPATPLDTLQDSLVIRAIVTDHSGLLDTAFQTVRLVVGPRVAILTPVSNDSVLPGTRLNVSFRATHPEGVSRVTVRIQGDTNWSPRLDTTITRTYTNTEREINDTTSVTIPRGVPGRSRVTISAEAADINRIPGEATPVVVRIRATPPDAPRVTQTVPTRAEIGDTIVIDASGDGFRTIGFIVRDSAGTVLRRDSVVFAGTAQDLSPRRVAIPLGLAPTVQGRRVSVVSFATDRNGRTGYSVSKSTTTPQSDLTGAFADSVLVVFGRTFALPRSGIAGDIAVDTVRGNVFVSNTGFNRLEVWRAGTQSFDPVGVAVGAEPWGMTLTANSTDTLLVANSGGTNISRVFIGASNVAGISERSRILTRNTIAYTVRETRDPATNKIRLQVDGPFSYSDRPQYIAQSAGGRIYYSTRPTTSAPAGTLRWLDPSQDVPDSRQVYNYGAPTPTLSEFSVFDVDFVRVGPTPTDSPESDTLFICDHPTGTRLDAVCVASQTGVGAAITQIRTMNNSDARAAQVTIASLALTDTTFVAWSGNRNWIAFGEGNTDRAGRVIMANDPSGANPDSIFFSPGVDVSDILENASERVFGLALDRTGKGLAVHGQKSYFSAVERPFHLRLQGEFDSFDVGAGIAFHPDADADPAAPGASPNTRLAFTAAANGSIEIIDSYFFVNRGRIAVRGKLYGPLRATGPLTAADRAAGIVMKLYGLTDQGLVVIDLTAADIKPGP